MPPAGEAPPPPPPAASTPPSSAPVPPSQPGEPPLNAAAAGPPEAPADQQQAPPAGGTINLNTVTFEQLRQESLSVTQATRLLALRERLGRFESVDDLNQVPGFPQEVLEDLKRRSTV